MFEISDELKALAAQVIEENKNLSALSDPDCRIVYMYSDNEKTRSGKAVFADTEKLSDKVKAVAGCDFIVTFYRPNCQGMNTDKMKLLMYHELKHVGFEPGGKCFIIPHDVEDFEDIIEQNGMKWYV